jgi:hypothetical protein
MSARWQTPLIASALCAILASGPSVNVAQAQCNHGGGGPRSSQGLLQQQQQLLMLQQQQQLLMLQQVQRQQLMQTAKLDREMGDLVKQGPEALKNALQDPKPEKRLLAAIAVGKHGVPLSDDLVELLTDDNGLVRQAARHSLVSLSTMRDGKSTARRSVDFGPAPDANRVAQKAAARKWRAWIDKQQTKTAKVDSSPAIPPGR